MNRIVSLLAMSLLCVPLSSMAAQIHEASKDGDLTRVQALMEKDRTLLNARDENGRTPLLLACGAGKEDVVVFLLARGADVRLSDDRGNTPLHAASALGDATVMKELMDKGADPGAKNLQGQAPLNLAASNGREKAVLLLIEKKADLENRDAWGRTPLITAARERGGVAEVAALLDANANVEAVDRGEDSALLLAAWRGKADVVDLLLERGAQAPITGQAGRTLLHFAVSRGLVRLFRVMVEKGADLSTETEGLTLLQAGAAGGSLPILQVLVEQGQNVNASDANGWAPLHFAVDLGRTGAVEFLLAKGADANARTRAGQSAYNIATDNEDAETAALLAARGADQGPPRFPALKGPYMGQKKPGKSPELFAGGIVSARYHLHSCIAFSPDGKEAVWSLMIPARGSGYGSGRTLVSRLEGGRWTYPKKAAYGGVELDDVPTYSPGGKKLYDMASRPLPGSPETGKEHIWVWERSGTEWARPKPAPGAVNEVPLHWQFGVDPFDNLYISTNVVGGRGGGDLYVSKHNQGRYEKPESLGDGVNTAADELTPFVSRDGRTLLFSRDGDLHASFLGRTGKWGEAKKLGGGVNTPAYELCPILTPDGKYLFFMRNWAVYWVDAGVVTEASKGLKE